MTKYSNLVIINTASQTTKSGPHFKPIETFFQSTKTNKLADLSRIQIELDKKLKLLLLL